MPGNMPGDHMRFGLPSTVRACLFDLDGVLTATATIHAAAWKDMFDRYLERRARSEHQPFVPFDELADYDQFVDGKPRFDGARAFFESRGIQLPPGTPDDPPGVETVWGLANRKEDRFVQLLGEKGVFAYEGSKRYLAAVRAGGLLTAVVSSSRNCRRVLTSAGLLEQFDAIVDGNTAQARSLRGKPAPDTYLEAARELAIGASEAAVFEDALAGVEAGRAGAFAYVVGVDRIGQAPALLRHGASVVVKDLAQLLEGP